MRYMQKQKAKSRLKITRRRKAIKKLGRITLAIEIIVCITLWGLVFDFTRIINNLETPASAYQTPIIIEKEVIREIKKAKVTAYSCGGLTTNEEILMNCPSLFSGEPKTANGTTPIPYKTMACDLSNMGKTFYIEGYGERTCTDTGGAIKGEGRFDLYVESVQEGYDFGVKYLEYYEVN